jgi:hypothetical protein
MSLPSCSYVPGEADLDPTIDGHLETLLPLNIGEISLMPETFGLGHLGILPMELLLLVLEELPLISIIHFRNTNRFAHYIVDTMPKFRIIVKQAPQAIRGVLAKLYANDTAAAAAN